MVLTILRLPGALSHADHAKRPGHLCHGPAFKENTAILGIDSRGAELLKLHERRQSLCPPTDVFNMLYRSDLQYLIMGNVLHGRSVLN